MCPLRRVYSSSEEPRDETHCPIAHVRNKSYRKLPSKALQKLMDLAVVRSRADCSRRGEKAADARR